MKGSEDGTGRRDGKTERWRDGTNTGTGRLDDGRKVTWDDETMGQQNDGTTEQWDNGTTEPQKDVTERQNDGMT